MKSLYGEADGFDPSNLTTIWSKDCEQLIIKVPISEAQKVLTAITMSQNKPNKTELSPTPLGLQILLHSNCLVNLSLNDHHGL